MQTPSSPTVNRRQLGSMLRDLRLKANKSIQDAATALGCHRSRVSKIENGREGAVATHDDVTTLCALYGVADDVTVPKLLGLLVDSQKQGWWEGLYLPPDLELYIGLETNARRETAHEPLLVHGALQTTDYARAVLSSTRTYGPDYVDDSIKLREGRQALLTRENNPLELWVVMDENVLRRPIGGPAVMREQLNHLRALGELPNVTIQVYPLAVESHPSLGGAFSLLEFETDPTVVYVDSPAGNLYVEKERELRRFIRTCDLLKADALGPDDSAALIERAAREMQ